MEMMHRFFWHQQNSLLWTGIYILSVPRSFICQGIWSGASEAHGVMWKGKENVMKPWHLKTVLFSFFSPLLILI